MAEEWREVAGRSQIWRTSKVMIWILNFIMNAVGNHWKVLAEERHY